MAARPLSLHGRKRGIELVHAADHEGLDGDAERAPTLLDLLNERS